MQITVLPNKQNQICGLLKVKRTKISCQKNSVAAVVTDILRNQNCGIVMYVKGIFGGGILWPLLTHLL